MTALSTTIARIANASTFSPKAPKRTPAPMRSQMMRLLNWRTKIYRGRILVGYFDCRKTVFFRGVVTYYVTNDFAPVGGESNKVILSRVPCTRPVAPSAARRRAASCAESPSGVARSCASPAEADRACGHAFSDEATGNGSVVRRSRRIEPAAAPFTAIYPAMLRPTPRVPGRWPFPPGL